MTFVIYNTNSQDFEAKAILGLTGSQIDGDDMAGYNKLGGTFGMGTNIYLSENISWQQEAVFYMRGAHASVQNASQKRAQMNYIDLNALLNYYFSESVFVQSGIGYGILMKAVS